MRSASTLGCLLLLVGCSSTSDEIGLVTAELPAGSDAAVVGHTIPTSMHPGERLAVTVTMRNTGTGGASNTWTPSSPTYAFVRLGANTFTFTQDVVEAVIPTGSESTNNFVLTAPTTPGTYSFSGRMGVLADGQFGETLTVPTITVSTATPRRFGCSFVSSGTSLPSTIAPGETRSVSVVVQNTGTATWSPSTFALVSQDSPASLWGNTIRYLSSSVAPGGTATLTFNITAPTTPGSYRFRRQMADLSTNGVGVFDAINSCVDATVTVGGTPEFDAGFVSNTLPTTLAPNEVRSVSVTVENTGLADWPAGTTVYLNSSNSPAGLYGLTVVYVQTATPAGSTYTFPFTIRAPSAPGTYDQRWRMRNSAGGFGPTLSVPLVVDSAATAALDAQIVAQSIPALVTAGRPATFSVTVANSGTTDWVGNAFALTSTSSPASLWGVTRLPLGAAETVVAGGTRLFSFSVMAPATPGTYSSAWRMAENPGAGAFGATATSAVTVTLCGNGVLDPGEQCDDGNLVDGDGCPSTCTVATAEYDLTSPQDRTLTGTAVSRQLANVEIGDVTGDGTVDVLVGEAANVVVGATTRVSAGIVYGFTTGAAFFTNTSTPVATSANFRILGASASDSLGVVNAAQIVIGDVTGDGVSDVIVSAPFADGEGEARADAGEVYVLAGGPALTGDIDLGAATPPSALRARVIGATAGDRVTIAAVGDLTGDGVLDLIVGAPFADTANGVDSGALFVVPGGATLTGTIDLAAPGVTTYSVLGPAANVRMGATAAAGQFIGGPAADLLVGAPTFTALGRSRSGAVWAVAGPLTGTVNLAASVGTPGGPSVAWLGATQNDNLGRALAIGNVAGSTAPDVVLGAPQQRRGAAQVGAVSVWDGATITVGSTYDLATATPTALFLGQDQYDNAGSALDLGDMNGDGYLDIPVASPLADGPMNARENAGELVVYFGSPTLSGTFDLGVVRGAVHLFGAASTDYLGSYQGTVAMGDIDGDGVADLCVGSYLGWTGREGRVDCVQSVF